MGGSQSNHAQLLKYVKKEWEVLAEEAGVVLVRNRVNDQEAQIINILHDPRRSMQKELQIYNYRYKQDNALVSVYAVDTLKLQNQPTLCGNFSTLSVVVQHIPFRLSDVQSLNFQEGLYVLSESLRGFDDLYGKVGKFDITDKMVGFNSAGKVKIWFNENFAQNHPPIQKPALQITAADTYILTLEKQQTQMVQNVAKLIQMKVEGGFTGELLQLINKQGSFIGAYQQIEKFCINSNLNLPDRLKWSYHNSNKTQINNLIPYQEIPLPPVGSNINMGLKDIQITKLNESRVMRVNQLNQFSSLKKNESQPLMLADSAEFPFLSSRLPNKAPMYPIIFNYVANRPN